VAATGDTVPIEVLWAGAGAVVLAAVVTVLGSLWQSRKTLRHQRELDERKELRTVIDEAAAHMDALVFDVMNAIADIREVAEEKSEDFSKSPRDLDADANAAIGETYRRAIEEVFAGIRKADGLKSRLAIRLGGEHGAVAAYAEATNYLRLMHRRLIDGTFLDQEAQGETFTGVGRQMDRFRLLCHKLVGTELG
jgi:hypothetical protein